MKTFFALLWVIAFAVTTLLIISKQSFLDGSLRIRRSLTPANSKPYDSSCPLSLNYFLTASISPEKGLAYSLDNDASRIVNKAISSKVFTDRKIVLIGDSNFRQIFSSIACISHTEGLWRTPNSYTAAMMHVYEHDFNDARLMLQEGLGEILLSPRAGQINSYGWDKERSPMETNEDWLKSCQDLRPFYMDTLSYSSPNEFFPFDSNDEKFQRVPLRQNDVVIINGSIHPSQWEDNLDKLLSLVDCMDEKKAKGEDPGWPQILYFRSNQRHFPTADKKKNTTSHCSVPREDPFIFKEKMMFNGRLPMVGFDLDLVESGHLHMSDKDCGHWAQPGVPDVYAKKMAEKILELETNFMEKNKK